MGLCHKSQQGPWSKCGLLIPDPLAMCVALCFNTVVKNTQQYFATYELNGKRTRGQVVIDYDGLFSAIEKNQLVYILMLILLRYLNYLNQL